MEDKKFCEDCVHVTVNIGWRCKHPQNSCELKGNYMTRRSHNLYVWKFCSDANPTGECPLWERRIPIWERFMNWVRKDGP